MENPTTIRRRTIVERFGVAAAGILLTASVAPVTIGIEGVMTSHGELAVLPELVHIPVAGETEV